MIRSLYREVKVQEDEFAVNGTELLGRRLVEVLSLRKAMIEISRKRT
jgi:hypothetical protein